MSMAADLPTPDCARRRTAYFHRRAQTAEAGLAAVVDGRMDRVGGQTFGRALANYAAFLYHGQLWDLRWQRFWEQVAVVVMLRKRRNRVR